MYAKIITASGLIGTATLAFALAGLSEPAQSGDGTCAAAWPNYPTSCLTTAEGRAVSKPVRLAAANPFPTDMPRPAVIGANPFAPEIKGVPLDLRFDDRNYFPEEAGHLVATLQ